MKASELIRCMQQISEARGSDPDVRFYSYEWDDDLEDKNYHERFCDDVSFRNGSIIIRVSREE